MHIQSSIVIENSIGNIVLLIIEVINGLKICVGVVRSISQGDTY